MMIVNLKQLVGTFAENKDIARDVRINKIVPALNDGKEVVLNFSGVDGVTQSFIHALISELIRQYGSEVLEQIAFKDCSENIQKVISIVVDYMQQS
jgi:hypothetical protein